MVHARSRASALFVLLLLAGLSSAVGSRSAVARTQRGPERGGDVAGERPNLLVVVTDDQRFDQLAAAGHPFLVTPTMDRLAAEGVRFSNAFVTTPICAASRASILTGRYEGTHGFTFGTPPIGPSFAADSAEAGEDAAGEGDAGAPSSAEGGAGEGDEPSGSGDEPSGAPGSTADSSAGGPS